MPQDILTKNIEVRNSLCCYPHFHAALNDDSNGARNGDSKG